MKEKLPNDKLEDFLKKSFEGYTESPPGDLWDKIEGGLEAAPAPKPFTFRKWWIAAAAAVVLGVFMVQHYYFQHKIDELKTELKQNEKGLQELETKTPDGKNLQTQNVENNEATPSETVPTASAEPAGGGEEEQQISNRPLPATAQKSVTGGEKFSKKQPGEANEIAIQNIENETVAPEEPQNSNSSSQPVEIAVTGLPDPASNPASSENLEVPALLDLLTFKVQPEQMTTPKSTIYQLPTDPVHEARLSAGVRVMPMATWERIDAVRPAQFPSRPGRPEKFFNNQQQVTGQVLAFGATLDYELDDHWSLVSGLDYLRTETSSSHRAEFMFKDRKPPTGGNPANRHDFNYNLNTSTGTVEVDVRVEATDPNLPVPDNEVLTFEVNTNKIATQLSVPLALKYTFGKGRLHGYLKGGLAANFLLNEDFNLTEVRSLNNRFKISPARPMRGAPQDLRTVSLSYLAAAGVEYDLTRSLSLSLEPTFMGSLSSRHSANFIRSSNYLAGVSAGLSYSF